jgi:hypothetical protein
MCRCTLYFLTLGAQAKYHSKTFLWARLQIGEAIRRSRVAVHKQLVMAASTYGLILAGTYELCNLITNPTLINAISVA